MPGLTRLQQQPLWATVSHSHLAFHQIRPQGLLSLFRPDVNEGTQQEIERNKKINSPP